MLGDIQVSFARRDGPIPHSRWFDFMWKFRHPLNRQQSATYLLNSIDPSVKHSASLKPNIHTDSLSSPHDLFTLFLEQAVAHPKLQVLTEKVFLEKVSGIH